MRASHRAALVLAPPLAVIGWLVWDAAPARASRTAERGSSSAAATSRVVFEPPAPPVARKIPEPFASRLALATDFVTDLDPRAERLLRSLIDEAGARSPECREAAERELARYRALVRDQARRAARDAASRARAFAAAENPAAIGWFAEAAACARLGEDGDLFFVLQAELDHLRRERSRRKAEADLAAIQSTTRPDDPHERDVLGRETLEQLARGDASRARDYLELIARFGGDGAELSRVLRRLAVGRRVLAAVRRLERDDDELRGIERGLAELEVRARARDAGRAVSVGDGGRAFEALDLAKLVAIDPVTSGNPKVLYLRGRAHEADGEPDEACRDYRAAIGVAPGLDGDPPVDLLRLLARGRLFDEKISLRTPGVGPQWSSVRRPSFTLFHERPGSARDLFRSVENARARARERLAFGEPPRVQAWPTVLFIFATEEGYRSSGTGTAWSAGHAATRALEDGIGRTIVTHEPEPGSWNLEELLVHEWAHVLVADHLGDRNRLLVDWVVEGVASFAESERERRARHEQYARVPLDAADWARALGTSADPGYRSADGDRAQRFYSRSVVAFEAAVRRKGSVALVLEASLALGKDEVDPFVTLGFSDGADFVREVDAVLKASTRAAPNAKDR